MFSAAPLRIRRPDPLIKEVISKERSKISRERGLRVQATVQANRADVISRMQLDRGYAQVALAQRLARAACLLDKDDPRTVAEKFWITPGATDQPDT